MTNPSKSKSKSWRDFLPVHPAAELFPPMGADELQALGEDIKKNGLKLPIALWRDPEGTAHLLDGRNRLDSIEAKIGPIVSILPAIVVEGGRLIACCAKVIEVDHTVDPYAYVISANIHRRHLTAEKRRALIGELLKQQPGKSDRQIAEQTKASPTTVGKIRKGLENTGGVQPGHRRADKRGVQQPAHKPPRQVDPTVKDAADRAEHRSEQTKRKQAADWALNFMLSGNGIDPQSSADQRKAEAKVDERRRRSDAEKAEASRRDTLLRIPAGAFFNVIALANEGFVAELHRRLDDELFQAQLKQIMRLYTSGISDDPVSDIQAGANALVALVRKLSPAAAVACNAANPPPPDPPPPPDGDPLDIPASPRRGR